jgi:sporulation protein YlmC with PRC-barrel domain
MTSKRHILAAAALTCGLAVGPAWSAYGDRPMGSADWGSTSGGANPDLAAASVDNLKGMSVQDKSGQHLGKVRDVLFDPSDGKIEHLIVSSSEAGAEKTYAVPFDSVRFDRDDNLLTLSMDRDELGTADTQFYGVGPSYGRTTRDDLSAGKADIARTESRPLVSFTADELAGMHVIDSKGTDLGTVRDVTIRDNAIDRVIVAPVAVSGAPAVADKVFSIPVDRLEYQTDQKVLAVDMTRDRLLSSQYYGVAPETGRIASWERRPLASFTADELRGMHVIDSRGNDLGIVREVTLDDGRIDRLIVASVPVSGVPEKVFAIPVDRVEYHPDDRVLAVNMTRDQLYTSEYYGVAPENSVSSDNTYGATMENKTGQPPERWELGSSPEGRNY